MQHAIATVPLQKGHLYATLDVVLGELNDCITHIEESLYSSPSSHLSGATIGQHVRHIIELFQCLQNGYEEGCVNYDKRKRDLRLETDPAFATNAIMGLLSDFYQENRDLALETALGGDMNCTIATNYERELLYNLEHAIHHMALIRVGVQQLSSIQLPETFGVAPATIQYRRECAQ